MKLLAAVALLVCAAACGPTEERASDLRLHEELSRLREDRGDRLLQLAVVKALPALTPHAAAAQDACVRAYTRLLDAEDAIARAEGMLRALPEAAPPTAVAAVASAEALLTAARADMPACEAASARLALLSKAR